MVKGIQITQAANAELINSFWLLDEATQEARCLCSKDPRYTEDQVVAVESLGNIEFREVPMSFAPQVEGGQHIHPCEVSLKNLMTELA